MYVGVAWGFYGPFYCYLYLELMGALEMILYMFRMVLLL